MMSPLVCVHLTAEVNIIHRHRTDLTRTYSKNAIKIQLHFNHEVYVQRECY